MTAGLEDARPIPSAPLDKLDQAERMRLRAAAFRATQVYRGPVGELVQRELQDWEQFGYRFGRKSFVFGLVEQVMSAQFPTGTGSPT